MRIDMSVIVQFERVGFLFVNALLVCTLHDELHDQSVVVGDIRLLAGRGLFVPAQPSHALAAAGEGHESEALGEDLILHNRGIIVHEDVFDGDSGDLGEEDAPEGVGDGGVEADEGEGGV